MKKFLSLLLVCVIFTAALIACGEQTEQKATDEVASQAPTDAPKADATKAEEEGGCGSTVALSALAVVPMIGAAVVLGKKKED